MPTAIDRVRELVASSPELRLAGDRLREFLRGPSDEELRQQRDASHWQPPHTRTPAWLRTTLTVVSGLVGATIIAASAPVWRLAVPAWRLTVPGIPHPGTASQSTVLFLIGLVLVAAGWLGLVHLASRVRDPRRAVAVVAVIIAAWAIPVSLGPPLLSNDVYSYVAQGEMASRGLDPGQTGPVELGRNDFTTAADPYWRAAPAPYGPAAVFLARSAVQLGGHDPAAAIDIYRVFVLLGVVAAAAGVGLIARSNGLSAAVAIAIGIGNPVVIIHIIGGAHNDAIMFGLLALGLALAQRGLRRTGVALLIAATAVKLPAVMALVYLGWCWRGDDATWRERLRTTAVLLSVTAATIVAAMVAIGQGPSWLTALRSTGKVNDTYSPTTKLGYSIAEILNGIGFSVDGQTLSSGVRALGLAATAVVALVMLLRSPRVGYIKATGVVLVAYVLLGPVIWPWYLPAGFALLAACGLGRYRPSYLVVCIAVSWFVWPTSVVSMDGLGGGYQHLRGLGVVVLVAALAWGAQRFTGRWERRFHGLTDAERDVAHAERREVGVG